MRIDNYMGGFHKPNKLPDKKPRKSVGKGSKPQKPDQEISAYLKQETHHGDALSQGNEPIVYRHTRLKGAASVFVSKGIL